MPPGLFQVIQN